jgi:hypothetical protein
MLLITPGPPNVRGVDSSNLTTEQVRRMSVAVARARNYLSRLRERIAFKSFPDADPLHVAVRRADEAVDSLYHLLAEMEQGTPRWIQARRQD